MSSRIGREEPVCSLGVQERLLDVDVVLRVVVRRVEVERVVHVRLEARVHRSRRRSRQGDPREEKAERCLFRLAGRNRENDRRR